MEAWVNRRSTVTISVPESGHNYQVQAWATDWNKPGLLYSVIGGVSSEPVMILHYCQPLVVGTFEADAVTQTFNVNGLAPGDL